LVSIHDAAEWLQARAATGRWAQKQEDEEATRERLLLGRLGQSFNREVERCCWRLNSVPTETLQWLASITSTSPSGVPFGRKGKEGSMSKYRSVGHRYLSFCWKAYRIGRKEALQRWAVRFTDEQWNLLHDVVEELERDGVPSSHDSGFYGGREREAKSEDEGKDKDKDKDTDEDKDDDDSDEDERGDEGITSSQHGALDRAVFNFIVASIKTHVGGNTYTNSLLCFCAALGIKQRPMSYTEPHLYTGMLAAILWWARLFFLEAVFEDQPLDRDEVGVEAVLAFQEQHTAWMCIGTHTVISTIIGWMAYRKGYRQKMGGQPSIRWSDDGEALFHMGEHISIEDFTRTLRDEVMEAQRLLDKLFGGGVADGQSKDRYGVDRREKGTITEVLYGYLCPRKVQATGRSSSLHGNFSFKLNDNLRNALKSSRHSMHHSPIIKIVNRTSRTPIPASECDLRLGICISRDRDRNALNVSP
jgi:hypothetical protein